MSEAIKPCPNCGSDELYVLPANLGGQVECPDCELSGPVNTEKQSGLVAWNAMPRREDFHDELMELVKHTDLSSFPDPDVDANYIEGIRVGMKTANGLIEAVAAKYAPAQPEKEDKP